MDCIVCGVTKIWTRLSDFHFIQGTFPCIFFFCVHRGACRRNPGLTGLAGQDVVSLYCCFVALVPVSCFCCLFCCQTSLLGLVAKQACFLE